MQCEKLLNWATERCTNNAEDETGRCAEHKLEDGHLNCQHDSVSKCKGCHPDCVSDDASCGCGF